MLSMKCVMSCPVRKFSVNMAVTMLRAFLLGPACACQVPNL